MFILSHSRHSTHRYRILILALLIVSAVLIPTDAWVEESKEETKGPKRPSPLFSVELKDEFKDHKIAFEKAKELILKNYYSPTISEEALYHAAIKGMLRHISPPTQPESAKLLSPEEFERIHNILKGKEVSIGIKSQFNSRDGSLTVTEVMPGSPAEGLLEPFDRILKIDGKSLVGLNLRDVNRLLEGEKGSKIKLTVVRGVKVFNVKVSREEIKFPFVKLSQFE